MSIDTMVDFYMREAEMREELREENKDLKEAIVVYEGTIGALVVEKDALKEKLGAWRGACKESERANEELSGEVTEYQDSVDAWFRKATKLQRENEELRHDNQSLQSISAYWLAEHDKQEAEKATLQDSLSAIKAVVDSATEDLLGG